MPLAFPPLYVIMDAALSGPAAVERAGELASAGVELIQYRDKQATSLQLFETCRELVGALAPFPVRLIVNDRADVAALTAAGGVHVGQDDLPVAAARAIAGAGRWVGVSTHTPEQVAAAEGTSADYVAFGPIFPTSTKAAAGAPVGLEGLRRARRHTRKPLVAIGGITLDRAEDVWRAGADSLAVAGDIAAAADPAARVRLFLERAAVVFGKRN
jgi:thiamine-phosphate pyrophosphorylase